MEHIPLLVGLAVVAIILSIIVVAVADGVS